MITLELELEPGYQTKRGSGSGEETAYCVEARFQFPEPQLICGQLFDNRWRRVSFQKDAAGVPSNDSYFAPRAALAGLYSYQTAQTLRWWFHAQAAVESFSAFCLESRLVEHKIKYTYETTATSAHCVVGGEDRSNFMPDWNQPRPKRIKE